MSCCQETAHAPGCPLALNQTALVEPRPPASHPFRRWNGGCISMIPALGLRSSVVPESPARPFTGQWPGPGPAADADPATEERYPSQVGPGVKPDPLANQLPRSPPPLRPRAAGMTQVPQVDPAAFRFRSCRVPQLGQVHLGSRFRFRLMVPQALQVLLLGNHMGARITRVWRHWPL